MLTIPFKSLIVLPKHSLKQLWSDSCRFTIPHLVDELSPGLDDSTFRAKRVFPFSIYEGLIFLLKKILCQLVSVLNALDATVHVTRVTQIGKTGLSFDRITAHLHISVFLKLTVYPCRTLWHVKLLVFFPAALVAVLDVLASADVSEDVLRAAVLTGTYDKLLTTCVSERKRFILGCPKLNYDELILVNSQL